jgi:hypothetical protein
MATKSGDQSLFGTFWMIEIVVMIAIPMLYMMNKATIVTDNPLMIAVGVLVMFFAFIGAVFLREFKVRNVTFGLQCFAYWLGAVIATILLNVTNAFDATSKLSFLSMGPMHIMQSIRGSLSVFEDMWITTQAIPPAEELFFLIVIPMTIMLGLDTLSRQSKSLSILGSPMVQILLAIPPTALMFAYIHVGMAASMAFFMSAVVFRSIAVLVVYGDLKMNLIPVAMIVPAFMVGLHRYWNINSVTNGNLSNYVSVMMSDPFGYLSLGVQLLYLLVAGHWLLKRTNILK